MGKQKTDKYDGKKMGLENSKKCEKNWEENVISCT